MDPVPSSPAVSRRMARQCRRDTAPERALRSELHSLGLRFFVDRAPLPEVPRRRADVVFPRARVACFVHGCFWHGCPVHGTWPRSNGSWWRAKIEANQERDNETASALDRAGWHVIEIWEHDEPAAAARAVHEVVMARMPSSKPLTAARR